MMNLYTYEINGLLATNEPEGWARIEGDRFVHASPATIHTLLFDFDQYIRIFNGVTEIRSDGVFPDTGGKLDIIYAAAKFKFQVSVALISDGPLETVLRFDVTNSQIESGPISVRGYGVLRFVPERDGTRLSAIFLYELPDSMLASQMEKQLIRPQNQANLERSLDTLKTLVEG